MIVRNSALDNSVWASACCYFSLVRSFTVRMSHRTLRTKIQGVFDLRLLQSYLDFQAQVLGFFCIILFFFSSNVNKIAAYICIYATFFLFGLCVFAICHFKRDPCFWTYGNICLRILVPFSMPSVRWTLNTRSRTENWGCSNTS